MGTPIDKELLDSATMGTKRKGQAQLIKYLMGGRVVGIQAIRAKCYDCNGMGETGECDTVGCPLYPFSPYKIDSCSTEEVKDE